MKEDNYIQVLKTEKYVYVCSNCKQKYNSQYCPFCRRCGNNKNFEFYYN